MNCLTLSKCNYIYFIVPTPAPYVRIVHVFTLLDKMPEVIQVETASYQILLLNALASSHLIPEILLASSRLHSQVPNGLPTTGFCYSSSFQSNGMFFGCSKYEFEFESGQTGKAVETRSPFSAHILQPKVLLLALFLNGKCWHCGTAFGYQICSQHSLWSECPSQKPWVEVRTGFGSSGCSCLPCRHQHETHVPTAR